MPDNEDGLFNLDASIPGEKDIIEEHGEVNIYENCRYLEEIVKEPQPHAKSLQR